MYIHVLFIMNITFNYWYFLPEQGCIQPGIGEPCVDNYRSLVQYHCATPFFFETVKIVVPPEKMRIARVRFSMYHKSTIICEFRVS